MDHPTPPRVLLVEDHEETRFVLRTILERAGWEVDETASGEDGLAIARHRKPDVVVVDISLPGVDGWEVSRRLTTAREAGRPRVLAVTAHGLDDDRTRADEAGCDGYLVKPVDPQRFLDEMARLRDAAEGAGGAPAAAAP